MTQLLLLALAGLIGQLVDGALGMAFGITTSTVLLASGIAPAAASQVVHLAELGTTLASGTAHWRFRNVDWRTVGLLAAPGAIGGFTGAVLLSSLSAEAAKPVISTILVGLGLLVLLRFARPRARRAHRRIAAGALTPLGLVAGFLDAMGGGGWGPMGTSTLLASGRMEPRKVIGSVSASEFIVTLGASAGFLVGLGGSGVNLAWVGALLAGGVVAAPLAAWTVRHLAAPVLGSAVGGLIVMTNAGALLDVVGVTGSTRVVVYGVVVVAWISAVGAAARVARDATAATPETEAATPRAAADASRAGSFDDDEPAQVEAGEDFRPSRRPVTTGR
jgi:hypothetical protein